MLKEKSSVSGFFLLPYDVGLDNVPSPFFSGAL
jgi:hypothetical protein